MGRLAKKRKGLPASLRSAGDAEAKSDALMLAMRQELYSWGVDPDAGRGVRVNNWGMLGLATARRCIEAIAGDLASMPLHLVKVDADDFEEHDRGHRLYHLFSWSPDGGDSTPIGFRQALVTNALGWGNGFAEIVDDAAGRPLLELRGSDCTQVSREGGKLVYRLEGKPVDRDRMLHLAGFGSDGVRGFNPVRLHATALGLTATAERFGSAFLANGAFPSGWITVDAALGDDEEAYLRLRDRVVQRHAEGVGKAGRVGILPPGFGFEKASVDPNVAQFLETRQFQILEICRIFGVPPHRAMDYSSMHYSTVEAVKSEFAQTTLLPWACRFEQSLNLRLLTEREIREGYTFRHDFTGFLRADSAGRAAMYRTLDAIGAICPNEVRAQEGYGRRTDGGGDEFNRSSRRGQAPAGAKPGEAA